MPIRLLWGIIEIDEPENIQSLELPANHLDRQPINPKKNESFLRAGIARQQFQQYRQI